MIFNVSAGCAELPPQMNTHAHKPGHIHITAALGVFAPDRQSNLNYSPGQQPVVVAASPLTQNGTLLGNGGYFLFPAGFPELESLTLIFVVYRPESRDLTT